MKELLAYVALIVLGYAIFLAVIDYVVMAADWLAKACYMALYTM